MKHPAKFSPSILDEMKDLLSDVEGRVLDPFAGTGRIHWLRRANLFTVGIEIEPEWATMDRSTICGNALHLPFPDASFDAICTSPCVTQEHRLLRDDLRWVPAGDIKPGDRVFAFDEHGATKLDGSAARRRWRLAEVLYSEPSVKRCVRVLLENGESFTCTFDHPWLANRYSHNTVRAEWVQASHLMSLHDPHVFKQLNPSDFQTSGLSDFWTGWTAGLLDGEGSLSYGEHGSPKLMMTQNVGPVLDRYLDCLDKAGFAYTVGRKDESCRYVYLKGGWPSLLSFVGAFQPLRLREKLLAGDLTTRTVQAQKVRVVGVEEVGDLDIQGIETSTGTFIGEGYLQHNTYGNRMADHHDAKDDSKRNTYKHTIGRDLHPDNSGAMHWGPQYRAFHESAWVEAIRVLKPGGVFILNVKNFIRKGEEIDVTGWHVRTLQNYLYLGTVRTPTVSSYREGSNSHLRVSYESVVRFTKPDSGNPVPVS